MCVPNRHLELLDCSLIVAVMNVFFARALAAHCPPSTTVISTSVCPGLCYSELRREISGPAYLLMRLGEAIIARTSEQGSRVLLWAALGPDGQGGDNVESLKGAFVMNASARESSDYVLSLEGKDAQEKLWVSPMSCLRLLDYALISCVDQVETIEILSRIAPEVREIVDKYYNQ